MKWQMDDLLGHVEHVDGAILGDRFQLIPVHFRVLLMGVDEDDVTGLEIGDELKGGVEVGSLDDFVGEIDLKFVEGLFFSLLELKLDVHDLDIDGGVLLLHVDVGQAHFLLLPIVFDGLFVVETLIVMPDAVIIIVVLFIRVLAGEVRKADLREIFAVNYLGVVELVVFQIFGFILIPPLCFVWELRDLPYGQFTYFYEFFRSSFAIS